MIADGIIKSDSAGHFIDDALRAITAGPFDVPGVVLGQLCITILIVGKQLQCAIAVRDVKQAGFQPDGVSFGALVVGDLPRCASAKIVDVKVLCPAALITFPGSEITK